jgi:hypothetical protein
VARQIEENNEIVPINSSTKILLIMNCHCQ